MVGRAKSVKGPPDEHHHHEAVICYTFAHRGNHARVIVARYQKVMFSPSSLPLVAPPPPHYVTLGTSGGGILGCEKSISISSLCSGRSCPVAFRLLMRILTETWFSYLKVISDCSLLLLFFLKGRAGLHFAPP